MEDSDFEALVPEEFRTDPTISGMKGLEKDAFFPTMMKSYVNAEKLIGAKRIALPTENATVEELNSFYSAIGRPETADKYEFPLAEGMVKDEEFEKYFRDKFHARGLPASMAKGIIEDWNSFVLNISKKAGESTARAEVENLENLKKEFGKAFDQNVAAARRAVDALGLPELKKFLDDKNLGNFAPLVKAFAKIGLEHYTEDKMRGGGGSGFVFTPEQAKTEIGRLLGDADFSKAYHDKMSPGHQAALDRMTTLYTQAYPE